MISDKYIKEYTAATIDTLVSFCHNAAKSAGWWTDIETGEPKKADVPEKLCLIHSEISEALEGYRSGIKDKHLPHLDNFDVELGDAVIRIFDLAGAMGIPLGEVIAEKMEYNRTREDHKPENRRKEGGKKF